MNDQNTTPEPTDPDNPDANSRSHLSAGSRRWGLVKWLGYYAICFGCAIYLYADGADLALLALSLMMTVIAACNEKLAEIRKEMIEILSENTESRNPETTKGDL